METQNIEYKESWRDEYLKWICGFANAQGGKIYIGMNDTGEVTGIENTQKLLEDIPNKINAHLGLVAETNLYKKEDKCFIEINIPSYNIPISYRGIYYYRSGSTKQELKGNALQHFLLKKIGKTWEEIPIPTATLDDLNENTIQSFIKRALREGRISEEAAKADTTTLLKNLRLINDDGQLINAALLLFGKNITRYFVTASFKIGRFGNSESDLRFQDIVETNILDMADKVLEILGAKYLVRPISYNRLERLEPLEYPEIALREAILNSIIHKDYAGTWIFLKAYNDRLNIWNPGKLPDNLTIDLLKEPHSSYPRNRLIAEVFFKAGYIEAWGRGISKIMDTCVEANLPEPVFREFGGGVEVSFLKDIYIEEYLRRLDLNERQIKAVLYVKEHKSITNANYQAINNLKQTISSQELRDLVKKEIFIMQGTKGRSVKYLLMR